MRRLRKEAYLIQKGVRVKKDGTIIGLRGEPLTQRIGNRGYKTIGCRYYGKACPILVHRLVAYAKYKGKIYQEGIVVRHMDGNPTNNSWYNIRIGTQTDNMRDKPTEEWSESSKGNYGKFNHRDILIYYKLIKCKKATQERFKIKHRSSLNFILRKLP